MGVVSFLLRMRAFYFPTVLERHAAHARAEQYRKQQREREEAACDICSGRSKYFCPICKEPISTHTHENDFLCATHSFVNPIRESDGALISGDGCIGVG